MAKTYTSGATNFMETGHVKKVLFTLGIPSMVAMIISVVYNFVDTIFIGQLNSTAAMGAVTVAYPIFMMISALGQLVGVGASSFASRMLGNKRNDIANKTASIAVILSIGFALITTIFGLLFLEDILTLMGASATVLPEGIKYTKWLLLGSIFTMLNMSLSSLVRSEGNSTASMVSLIIGAVVNILLDPLFMFTFHGGIAGASLATVVGQMCSTAYLIYYYMRGKSIISIQLKGVFKFASEDTRIYKEIFKIGVPVCLMQFLISIASSILNTSAMPYGDSAVAAMGIANRVYTLPVYLIAGFIQGFQPFVAYNYGAKLYGRLNQAIKFTFTLLISSSLVFSVLFISFPSLFVGMFTSDTVVMQLGCNALSAMSLLFPFVAIILILIAIFQGIGKAKESAIISISRQGFLFIPMALILPRIFASYGMHLDFITQLFPSEMPYGMYGVMLTQPISDCLATILAICVSIRPLRDLKKQEEEPLTDVSFINSLQ